VEVTNMTRRFLACALALMAALAAQADSPKPQSADEARSARIAEAAKQAWSITDLVLENDIDPPSRQEMLLHALKAVLSQKKEKAPANLATRVSSVTTPEQFTALLAELWPNEEERREDGPHFTREQILFDGLLGWRMPNKEPGFYLTPQDVKRQEVLVGNRYVGTGIQIRRNDKEKLAQIMIPFPGGPARKAGARPGDLIVEVDGKNMEGLPLLKVVQSLQGEEGTKVSMAVRQPGETKTRLLPMVRSIIPFSSVHGYRRTGEESWSFRCEPQATVGYLALDEIKSSTLLELRKIEPLVRAEGVRALVLDLRFTRGQDIRHAALVADGLIDGGVLWRVRDCRGRTQEYKADRDCLFRDIPMAVLVGEHTGSLGAILAAALQDRGRAILVGEMPNTELFVTNLVRLPEERGAVLLRTGKVERSKPASATEQQRLAAAANRLEPDHRVAIERKETNAVLEWRHEQQSPEPKADAKPPADPQLDRAAALLQKTLTEREKKGQP
jgi:C-terminal peptidase prc